MKLILAVSLTIALVILVHVEAIAQEKPPTPLTGVYVAEIDENWVRLEISSREAIAEFEDQRQQSQAFIDEVMHTAEFACSLYKRNSVFLSGLREKDDIGISVVRISFLFACALP